MTDLIERWQKYSIGYAAGDDDFVELYEIASEAIAALQPVDDADVGDSLAFLDSVIKVSGLTGLSKGTAKELHDLINHLSRQNRELEAARDFHIKSVAKVVEESRSQNREQQAKLEAATKALEEVRDDLLLRGDTGRGGERVVNLSASVWDTLNDTIDLINESKK